MDSVSSLLDDRTSNTTILAPVNAALQKLSRKPWEDPDEYQARGSEAYVGTSGERRAADNLRRFVQAHIVPLAPWNQGAKVQTSEGQTVWWEERDGQRVVSSWYWGICTD